jgi:uncharacterized protein YrrD
LDKVEDIVYDPYLNKVRALVLDPGGWFRDARIILMEDVHSIGQNAVVIASSNMVKVAADVTERVASIAKNDQNLTRTRVMTDSGNELGRVSDIIFDPKTGQVEEFEVSQGLQNFQSGKKTIKVDHILTIGKDVTVVKAGTEDYINDQADQQGIQGAFMKTKDEVEQTPTAWEQMKAEARDMGESIKAKSEEVRENPRTQTLIEKLEAKTNELKERWQNRTLETQANTRVEGVDAPPTEEEIIADDALGDERVTRVENITAKPDQPAPLGDLSEKREAERLGYNKPDDQGRIYAHKVTVKAKKKEKAEIPVDVEKVKE